jgi:hypothetical protein
MPDCSVPARRYCLRDSIKVGSRGWGMESYQIYINVLGVKRGQGEIPSRLFNREHELIEPVHMNHVYHSASSFQLLGPFNLNRGPCDNQMKRKDLGLFQAFRGTGRNKEKYRRGLLVLQDI